MATQAPGEGLRLFSLEEANALLPALEIEFGRLARLRGDAALLVEALGSPEAALAVLQGSSPSPEAEGVAERFQAVVGEINQLVERVNGLGCLVKDLDRGLVDFLSLREGNPVFLCWQFGEPAVAHWHTLEGGFAGRQAIEGAPSRPAGPLN